MKKIFLLCCCLLFAGCHTTPVKSSLLFDSKTGAITVVIDSKEKPEIIIVYPKEGVEKYEF